MLLDAKPPKPPTGIRKYIPIWALVLIVLVVGGAATYSLIDLPEEMAIERFLNTLERAQYHQAYNLWKPSSDYSYANFMSDWGPKGDYGMIKTYKVLSAKSKGSDSVVVKLRINNENPPLDLVVDRRTKSLSYSPFF